MSAVTFACTAWWVCYYAYVCMAYVPVCTVACVRHVCVCAVACVRVCLPACLRACVPVCLYACVPACLRVWLSYEQKIVISVSASVPWLEVSALGGRDKWLKTPLD